MILNDFLLRLSRIVRNKLLLVCISAVVVYFTAIFFYSHDFPFYNDDYHAVLQFLNKLRMSRGFWDVFDAFFEQHNEHRIFFTRFVSFVDWAVFGTVNFKRLIVFGNLGILFIGLFMYKIFKGRLNEWLIVTILLAILNFSYCQLTFWPMASIQLVWVYVFVFYSLYLIHKQISIRYFYIGTCCAMLATFTSANGMLVFIVGNWVLYTGGKKKIEYLVWNIAGLFSIFFYFRFFQFPSYNLNPIEILQNHPDKVYAFVFVLLGSSVDFFETNTKFLFGHLIAVSYLYMLFNGYAKKMPLEITILTFVFLTILLTAVSRAAGHTDGFLGWEDSRYYIVSVLFLAMLFLSLLVERFRDTELDGFLCTLLVSISISYDIYTFQSNKKYFNGSYMEKWSYNYKYGLQREIEEKFNFSWGQEDKTIPKAILKQSDSLGVFHSVFTSPINPLSFPLYKGKDSVVFNIVHFQEDTSRVLCFGWAGREWLCSDLATIFYSIIDMDGKVVHTQSCIKTEWESVNEIFKPINKSYYKKCGFHIDIKKILLQKGEYTLSLYITDDKTISRLDSRVFRVN
jgi:hypothetical protein